MSKVALPSETLRPNSTPGFYEYRQNNSGGNFDINHNVSVYVIIEAKDAKEADTIAEQVGIYFNGCDRGVDCWCCGDRWYRNANTWSNGAPDYDALEAVEKVYGVQTGKGWERKDHWVDVGEPYAIVYMLNGDKIVYSKDG